MITFRLTLLYLYVLSALGNIHRCRDTSYQFSKYILLPPCVPDNVHKKPIYSLNQDHESQSILRLKFTKCTRYSLSQILKNDTSLDIDSLLLRLSIYISAYRYEKEDREDKLTQMGKMLNEYTTST